MASAEVQAQPLPLSGIYGGKFNDRSPDIYPAGKLTMAGDSAVGCLKPADRPTSPDVVKKFRASLRPDAGKKRIFYGRANDPHLKWAADMTHGLRVKPSIVAGKLLNPEPNTLFKQRLIDRKESIYTTHVKGPLGTSHDQTTRLPPNLDKYGFTFGMRTAKDGSAGELVSPDKTRPQVEEEYENGRDLYRESHFGFRIGEQKNRNYTSPSFKKENKFGGPTPHDNAGKQVKTTLKWLHEEKCERMAPIVSKRADDFRERTQPVLGKVHDPIKDTLNVADDHTFGILIKPDEYGVGDLLHCRPKGNYRRGKDRENGLIAAVRQQLKKANYHNFNHLYSAFQHYDSSGTGRITRDDLRKVCFQFHLNVDDNCLNQLMSYCDVNSDGLLDYMEFCNFLNWKDKMRTGQPSAPSGGQQFKTGYSTYGTGQHFIYEQFVKDPNCVHSHTPCDTFCRCYFCQQPLQRILGGICGCKVPCNCLAMLDKPGNESGRPTRQSESANSAPPLVNDHPECGTGRPSSLTKQIDPNIGHHQTSSSMINSVIGGVSTQGYRRYGVPTVRTDLAAPRVKRVSDHKNYGDESDAYGLVNPSVYTTQGVYERDFLLPRSKTEIREIFLNIGLRLDYDTFENLYQVAAAKHPRGFVSVEGFRNVLDEAQATHLKKTPVL